MAPSLLLTKMPMTPLRVMGMVVAVCVICLIFSAFKVPPKSLKLDDTINLPRAAAAAAAAAPIPHHIKHRSSGRIMADPNFWHTYNFQSEEIPSAVLSNASKVQITKNYVNIMGAKTFYREAQPPAGVTESKEVVLLLHGAAFKSANWEELNTINLLAAMGHRVIAVDLPGYGRSEGVAVPDRAEHLHAIITTLNANKPIVVSPSMSGSYSLPFLNKYPEGLSGYVPVAPVGTGKESWYRDLKVPTLIIYGQKDTSLGHTSRDDLSNIPSSQVVEIPKARHPAYLDDPNLFHKLLYNFIKQISMHRENVTPPE